MLLYEAKTLDSVQIKPWCRTKSNNKTKGEAVQTLKFTSYQQGLCQTTSNSKN